MESGRVAHAEGAVTGVDALRAEIDEISAMLCREHGLPEQVVHLVLTHTATSLLAPEPLEGVVLHYADFFAADAALHEARADLLMSR